MLFISLFPTVNALIGFNAQISFPENFTQIGQWFKEIQIKQEQLIEKFTRMNTLKDFFLNVFVMALVPAFGEELFFRGVLQKIAVKWKKNIHFAVFLTAFLFALTHQQFYTFIPIMFLGTILGYIYYLTANIWLPIIIHFLNNFLAILASYLKQQNEFLNSIEDFVVLQNNSIFLMASILISGVLFFILYKKRSLV